MKSVLIDDHSITKMNPRISASLNRGPAARPMNLYSSMSSLSQMISMDANQANVNSHNYYHGLYDHHAHAPFVLKPHYSFPQSSSQHFNHVPQPPLLPFPNYSLNSNSKPAGSTTKKNSNITSNNYKHGATRKKLSKPFTSSKSPSASTKSISEGSTINREEIQKLKLVQKTSSSSKEFEGGQREDETIYPLSPPPSSLPLPSLALIRHRVAIASTVSCTAEAVGGGNGNGAIKEGNCDSATNIQRLLHL